MDRDHDDTRKTQLRESCSLSVLNQRHLSIVKNFKSSDNLHRVVLHVTPPTTRKPTIFFNLRKSRKREKYSKKDERAKENDNTDKGKFGIYKKHPDKVQIRNDNNSPLQAVLSNLKNDDMAQSWQSSNLSSSKSLFNLFRTTRSRSGTNNCIVSACPDPCCSSSTSDPRSTLSSMEEKRSSSVIRRRRPRSAHLDPNTLVFPPRVSMISLAY
ncbi:unnamed protein product [Wuchereria bancrofti]|uniref:Uncharacterized protein n=1 Tax=Wuchereria bancrofti TaxID=6293 RepID=A0A3P7F265_WUCBA|nr:unnamed protein product [Wuchereria bancrofti]